MISWEAGVARGKAPLSEGETERSAQLLAAEYVRMSTEHQQYSTQNQAQTIREYAERRIRRLRPIEICGFRPAPERQFFF